MKHFFLLLRPLILFLLLLNSSATLAQTPYSSKIHRFDGQLAIINQGLHDFLIDIRDRRIPVFTTDRIEFYEAGLSTDPSFGIFLVQEIKGNTYTLRMYFSAGVRPAGQMLYKKTGGKLKLFTPQEILDGELPNCDDCTAFETHWPDFGLRMTYESTVTGGVTTCNMFDGSLQIDTIELTTPKYSMVRSQFLCANKCNDTAFEAFVFDNGQGQYFSKYYIKPTIEEQTPAVFTKIYQSAVVPIFYSFIFGSFKSRAMGMGWPIGADGFGN
jgi:hypothetical protein